MNKQQLNTIVIGAGQGGLSVSYCLTKKDVKHLVLEKGKIANGWRENRWDSFRLITPNYMTILPGFTYKGKDPNGFDTRDQMTTFFEDYATSFNAPVKEGTRVYSVSKNKNGFLIKTSKGAFEAKNVVVAIGSFHKPIIPKVSKSLPKNITQLHSSEYKNAKQLPKGAVLVVGGGNSGIQIAVDLNKSGRKVYLSLGRLRIVPRHYREKDFMEWAKLMGVLDRTNEEATPEIKNLAPPALFGTPETVDIRKIAKDGVQLLGRLTEFKNGNAILANDLLEHIEKGEAALSAFKNAVDKFASDRDIYAPQELNRMDTPGVDIQILPGLNLKDNNVTSVIWATGFKDDYSWLKVNVFDENGEPIHKKGVSKTPGLYFIGLRWLSKYKSFLLCGIAEDAEYIADQIKNWKD